MLLLLRELLGFGVGFAGAIVCFAVRASSSASSVSNEAARESQERMPKGYWQRSWAVGREVVVTGPAVWVDGGEGLSWWSCLDSLPLER